MPSKLDGTMVDSNRDPRRGALQRPPDHTDGFSIPVEDGAVLNRYHERYEELKIDRANQRERAIKKGLMADPNQPTYLNQAITPVGTCTSMCPEYERVERIVQKMVDKSEKFLHPSTGKLQNMETKMLKRFRRSAAGYDEQLPSDIRTPQTLLQTTNYLIRHVIGGDEPLGLIHKFAWDRTRSIRNDLSVQQLTQENHVRMAVTCLERIARFHILSLHLLSSPANEEPFDHHQEREQLNNTMLSLMYYYDDNRGRISFPNEDEFRAYYIIFSIHDQRPDLESRVQKWPSELRRSPRVQAALEMFAAAGNTWEYQGTLDAKRPNAIAQGFYTRFFSLIDSPTVSYLTACVAEIYFNHMRQTAIRSIWKAYCRSPLSQQHRNEEWTIDELTTALYFDNNDQTMKFCQQQDLELKENTNGELCLNWGNRPVDSVAFQPSSEQTFSEKYVESKRAGRTLVALILGLNVKEAASLGMINRSLLPQRIYPLPTLELGTSTDDDALFVSDDDNEPEVLPPQPNGMPEILTSTSPSSLDKSFEELSQPIPDHELAATQQGVPESSSNPSLFQPSDSTKTFSSLFAPEKTGGTVLSSSPVPSLFAFSSPFPSSEASQTNESVLSGAQKSPFAFSLEPTPFTSKDQKDNITTTTLTPAFQLKPSYTPQDSAKAPESPFNIIASSLSTRSDQATRRANDHDSVSLFNSIKKPTFSGAFGAPTGSIFNFTGPNVSSKELDTGTSPVTSEGSVQVASPLEDNGLVTEKDAVTFTPPTAEPVATISKPTSPEPRTSTTYTETQTSVENKQTSVGAAESLKQHADEAASLEDRVASTVPAPPIETTLTTDTLESATNRRVDEVEDPLACMSRRERHHSWIQALKDVAERRRQQEHIATRKRALDENQEQESAEIVSKAQKGVETEVSPPCRSSLALYSIKSLPTLPILEKTEQLLATKPAARLEPQPKAPSLIDQDELLLSAARIAAETLRSGPKIFDIMPPEPNSLRSSLGHSSSLPSSQQHSRSQSPLQTNVNGYDVAFAPETDLGLGRSLSRTEQRIRRTGGRGLAYKPLNFTPEKYRKTEKYK